MASSIEGLEALRKKLLALSPKLRAKLEKAVMKSAEDVAESARNLAPVGKTGKLKASIKAVQGDLPREEGGQKVFGNLGAKGDNALVKATVYAGDGDAWYARLVEFGVAPHEAGGEFKGTQHPGVKARPFFFPAVRARKKANKSRISRAMREAIKEITRT